jgi:protein-disulfide isomerase
LPRGRARILIVAAALALLVGALTARAADAGRFADQTLGAAEAPVTVVEYFSPTCPHCAHFRRETLAALTPKYVDSGQVRFVFHEFPVHPDADTPIFLLAHCVGEEGYWKVIDQVTAAPGLGVSEQPRRRRIALLQIARSLGMSTRRARTCLADARGAQRVKDRFWRDMDKDGIDGAPTFVVNGVRLDGAHAWEVADFEAVLNPLLAAKAGQP